MNDGIDKVTLQLDEEEPRRKGIAKVEIEVTYEDGWVQKIETPALVRMGPAQRNIQTPNGVQVIARYTYAVEIMKTVELIEHVLEDLKNTIPTEEERIKAESIMRKHSQDLQQRAQMIAEASKGRTPGKGTPMDKAGLVVPPGAPRD